MKSKKRPAKRNMGKYLEKLGMEPNLFSAQGTVHIEENNSKTSIDGNHKKTINSDKK